MNENKYYSIVKASAWYDLIVVGLFAFPIVAQIIIDTLTKLHTALSFHGSFPAFEPMHIFFVNIMGSITIVWSILRIRHVSPIMGLYDSFARTLISVWMVVYLIAYQVTPIVLFLLVPEMLWGVVQCWGYWKYKKSN